MSRVIQMPIAVEQRETHCDRHGPYTAKLLPLGDGHRWTGCPACAKDAIDRARLEREESQGDELLAAKGAAMHDAAGVPKRLLGATLSSYAVNHGEPQETALRACCEYVRAFQERAQRGDGLILMGSVGTGKTHLACAIIRHVTRKQGVAARYVSAPALFTRIKASYGGSGESEADIIREYSTTPLLVVDELGIGKGSDAELNMLYAVFGHRYDACLPTVLATNLNPDELRGWLGERVVDRLRETNRVVMFQWPSYRGGAL